MTSRNDLGLVDGVEDFWIEFSLGEAVDPMSSEFDLVEGERVGIILLSTLGGEVSQPEDPGNDFHQGEERRVLLPEIGEKVRLGLRHLEARLDRDVEDGCSRSAGLVLRPLVLGKEKPRRT